MRRLALWLQILSAIGVLAGLLLVVLQLQQNEELLRFQIASELNVNRDNERKLIRGEEYSTTMAKLQLSPDELSDEEVVEFNAHAQSIVSELVFRRMLFDAGIFQGNWRGWLVYESCDLLDNEMGEAWLNFSEGKGADSEIIEELRRRNAECGKSFLRWIRDQNE